MASVYGIETLLKLADFWGSLPSLIAYCFLCSFVEENEQVLLILQGVFSEACMWCFSCYCVVTPVWMVRIITCGLEYLWEASSMTCVHVVCGTPLEGPSFTVSWQLHPLLQKHVGLVFPTHCQPPTVPDALLDPNPHHLLLKVLGFHSKCKENVKLRWASEPCQVQKLSSVNSHMENSADIFLTQTRIYMFLVRLLVDLLYFLILIFLKKIRWVDD